jgi:hypothetical protein
MLTYASTAAQQPHWSPPVGKEKRGTMRLPSWRATRHSCRPARTCSVPGGGTDAVQSASLNCPSLSFGFRSGLAVSPPVGTFYSFYPDHIQHTTIIPSIQTYPTRAAKVRYKIEVADCNSPWAASMRPYMQRLMGTDSLGAKTLDLLTAAWAKSTSDTYYSAIRPYF